MNNSSTCNLKKTYSRHVQISFPIRKMKFSWVTISLLLIFVQTQIEVYLRYRQRNAIIISQSPPEIFKDNFTFEEFSSARSYELDKINYAIILTLVDGLKMCLLILLLKYFWKITRVNNQYVHSILFSLLLGFLYVITNVPTKYYSNFVIEENHGFNNLTFELFISDQLKVLLIISIAVVILVPLFVLIYNKAGSKFIYFATTFYLIVVIAIQLLFPIVIYPLFTKLTPITEGEIFNDVMKLGNRTNFPVTEIYVADDSKRSSHQNAMVFGLFTKKIAIADTLLNKTTPEEISAIVGHEIGHSKHHHIPKMLVLEMITMFITFTALIYVMKSDAIFRDFGIFNNDGSVMKPFIVGLLILELITSPINTILQLPINFCMRSFEYQADAYSASLNLPIDISLIKLSRDNKMAIEPDMLYSAFIHSHPTTSQRVKAIREIFKTLNPNNDQ